MVTCEGPILTSCWSGLAGGTGAGKNDDGSVEPAAGRPKCGERQGPEFVALEYPALYAVFVVSIVTAVTNGADIVRRDKLGLRAV
jgi:hypothetical protein